MPQADMSLPGDVQNLAFLNDLRRNRHNPSRLGVPPLQRVMCPSRMLPARPNGGDRQRAGPRGMLKGRLNSGVVCAFVRGRTPNERIEFRVIYANRQPMHFVAAAPHTTCWCSGRTFCWLHNLPSAFSCPGVNVKMVRYRARFSVPCVRVIAGPSARQHRVSGHWA